MLDQEIPTWHYNQHRSRADEIRALLKQVTSPGGKHTTVFKQRLALIKARWRAYEYSDSKNAARLDVLGNTVVMFPCQRLNFIFTPNPPRHAYMTK